MHFSTLVQFEDFLSISPFLSISRKSENTICPPCCFASEISVTHTSLLKCQVSLFWCLESRLLTPWCVQEIRTHCSIYCICVVWTFKRLDVAKSDFDAVIWLGRRKRGTLSFFLVKCREEKSRIDRNGKRLQTECEREKGGKGVFTIWSDATFSVVRRGWRLHLMLCPYWTLSAAVIIIIIHSLDSSLKGLSG